MDDVLQVGIIASTHGLKGEVKVYPTTDDVERYKQLKNVIIENGSTERTLQIQNVKFFKKMVIVKFEGFDKIEEIEKYIGTPLYITRDQAVKLEKNEYFIADLIGLTVIEETGKELGTIIDVLVTGANDVYVIRQSLDTTVQILIPAIKECILDVNIKQGKMRVHLLEGLL